MRFRRTKAAQQDLDAAARSLADAREARAVQVRKREAEQALAARLERLAGRDSNHLGALVLEALTEKYHRGGQHA